MWPLLYVSLGSVLLLLSVALFGAWVLKRRRRPTDGVQGPEPDFARLVEGPKGERPDWTPMRDRSFDKPAVRTYF